MKEKGKNIGRQVDELAERQEELTQQMKRLHDQAVEVYTPLVEELCSRRATRDEVECMFDLLLTYAEDDRIRALCKRLCRSSWTG